MCEDTVEIGGAELNRELTKDAGENQELSIEEWRREFQLISETLPQDGDFLFAKGGQPVQLRLTLSRGRPPFIHTRAYVTCVVGEMPMWHVVGPDDPRRMHGLRVILASNSRNDVIRRFGISCKDIQVKGLRVLRQSETGQSIIAEVCDW